MGNHPVQIVHRQGKLGKLGREGICGRGKFAFGQYQNAITGLEVWHLTGLDKQFQPQDVVIKPDGIIEIFDL